MPETTTPLLSESDIEQLEMRTARSGYYDAAGFIPLTQFEFDALIRDWRAMKAERDCAMNVMQQSMPENGLEDACRQRMQAYITERDNCEELERQNAALREQLARVKKREADTVQLIRDQAARYGNEEGLSYALEALAADLENNHGPDEQAKEVQCADCFVWFNSNSNHTCRRQVRRNQRRRTAAELTQLEGERD